jgi:hypothetical protein
MAPGASGDDIEVTYDKNGAPVTVNKSNMKPVSKAATTYTNNHGNAPYVDFENVFDPFERESDDVAEFFDEDGKDDDEDVENPFRIFHDPRKVRTVDDRNSSTRKLICIVYLVKHLNRPPLNHYSFCFFTGRGIKRCCSSNCW